MPEIIPNENHVCENGHKAMRLSDEIKRCKKNLHILLVMHQPCFIFMLLELKKVIANTYFLSYDTNTFPHSSA